MQEFRSIILSELDKFKNDLKINLNSCNFFYSKVYKTSKCQLIYRNVSKTSDRNNEKTLKVDKIEFFGNFSPKFFWRFAVTLLARPNKLDLGDHSCFASSSFDN